VQATWRRLPQSHVQEADQVLRTNYTRRALEDRQTDRPRTPDARRYISEDLGGVALHPVDLMDAATGRLLGQLADPNLTTICPVNKPHPRLDLILSGSSRSLYAWAPEPPSGACNSLL
jgi:hypothetical protein